MARKPVSEFIGGKGPRQLIWDAIRSLADRESITEADIWNALVPAAKESIELGNIRDYRRGLVLAGILAVVTPAADSGKRATFCLAKDEGLEAPRVRRDGSRVTQGLAQEQMWRTLRMATGDTNGRELAAYSSTPEVPVSEVAARDYLQMLFYAGYLVCTKEGKGTGKGGVQARFRLLPSRNTGPRPPMICRAKVVYDANEDKVVWAPRVTDEDAIYGQ